MFDVRRNFLVVFFLDSSTFDVHLHTCYNYFWCSNAIAVCKIQIVVFVCDPAADVFVKTKNGLSLLLSLLLLLSSVTVPMLCFLQT